MNDSETAGNVSQIETAASQASEQAQVAMMRSMWDEEVREILRHYSPFEAKRIQKRMGILLDCKAKLSRDLNVPDLRIKDLRQMFPVVLAPVLNDGEKMSLVCRLYSEIARHPQWTTRGNVLWIERQLLNAISEKEARLARVAIPVGGSETLAVRKAA